jgi:SpoVT / AbrB like domain.
MKQVYLASDIFIEIPDDPENVIMVIPSEICEAAGLETGDKIVVRKEGESIVLEKQIPKIYESPDGGKTIYSRNFGSKERELIDQLSNDEEK